MKKLLLLIALLPIISYSQTGRDYPTFPPADTTYLYQVEVQDSAFYTTIPIIGNDRQIPAWGNIKDSFNKPNFICYSIVDSANALNSRNDFASYARLGSKIICAYNHYDEDPGDFGQSQIHYNTTSNGGITWDSAQMLLPGVPRSLVNISFHNLADGNLLALVLERDPDTLVLNIRRVIFDESLNIIDDDIVFSDGYLPAGAHRIYNDNGRLLFPYPKLIHGLGSSLNSIYQARLLVSTDNGITWGDEGIGVGETLINTDSVGGATEPVIAYNPTIGKLTMFFRTVLGNVYASDLTYSAGNYTFSAAYNTSLNTSSAETHVITLNNLFIAAKTRLINNAPTPTNTRTIVDLATSIDNKTWSTILTLDQIPGGYVNNHTMFVDTVTGRLIVTWAASPIQLPVPLYTLKSISIPLSNLVNTEVPNSMFNTNPAVADIPTVRSFNEYTGTQGIIGLFELGTHVFKKAVSTSLTFYNKVIQMRINGRSAIKPTLNYSNFSNISAQVLLDSVQLTGKFMFYGGTGFGTTNLLNGATVDTGIFYYVPDINTLNNTRVKLPMAIYVQDSNDYSYLGKLNLRGVTGEFGNFLTTDDSNIVHSTTIDTISARVSVLPKPYISSDWHYTPVPATPRYVQASVNSPIAGSAWGLSVPHVSNASFSANLAFRADKLYYETFESGVWGGWRETLTTLSVIPANRGGTGTTSYAVGDLLTANSSSTLSKIADVATGNVLRSGGVGVIPAWGKLNLATDVTGTVSFANLDTSSVNSLVTQFDIRAGAYIPTITNVSNILSSAIADSLLYTVQGNIVTIFGKVTMNPNAAGSMSIRITLPVASNFTNTTQLFGTATQFFGNGVLEGDDTNDQALITIPTGLGGDFYINFRYKIL